LPDDIKYHEEIKRAQDIATLAKNHVHAQKLIGADKVPLPGKYATPEDWQAFYDKIGRPPLDKYEVKVGKDSIVDEAWVTDLKKVAHKEGIMPSQLEAILAWYDGKAAEELKNVKGVRTKEVEEGLSALKKDWGKAYNTRVGYAKSVVEKFGDKELVEMLNNTGLTDDSKLIRLLGKIGEELFKEDTLPDGNNMSSGIYDPAQAVRKANEIIASPQHPYNNPEHPKHHEAKQEVSDLFSMAYPQADA
jgi:hypothetical protein